MLNTLLKATGPIEIHLYGGLLLVIALVFTLFCHAVMGCEWGWLLGAGLVALSAGIGVAAKVVEFFGALQNFRGPQSERPALSIYGAGFALLMVGACFVVALLAIFATWEFSKVTSVAAIFGGASLFAASMATFAWTLLVWNVDEYYRTFVANFRYYAGVTALATGAIFTILAVVTLATVGRRALVRRYLKKTPLRFAR